MSQDIPKIRSSVQGLEVKANDEAINMDFSIPKNVDLLDLVSSSGAPLLYYTIRSMTAHQPKAL